MKYRVLGRTGLEVSEIGFGGWAIGGNEFGNSYGSTDDQESIRAIRKALDSGCNFFDTADVYGHGRSEIILGQTLKSNRKDLYIATKVGGDFYAPTPGINFSPEYIAFAVDQSLGRLETDYIDLYQLHNPTLDMIKDGSVFDIMEKLRDDGKIRFIGVSIFDPVEGIEAIKIGKADAIQVVYNIFSQGAAEELFPLALQNNIGIVAREPLANGFLTGKYTARSRFEEGDIRCNWPSQMIGSRVQVADSLKEYLSPSKRSLTQWILNFVLARKAVSVVIPGSKTEEQVEENLGASDVELPTDAELEQLRNLFRR